MSLVPVNERLVEEDDYLWLDMPIPEEINNPFPFYDLYTQPEDPVEEMTRIMADSEYLHFTCRHLLGVELLPFQCVTLDLLWRKRFPMLIATRGFSKSFLLAVYTLLRLILNPGCKVAVVGAAFRQSREVWENCSTIWNQSHILKDIAGRKDGPKREIDRCEFKIGRSRAYFLPMGDGRTIRGTRANYIIGDEFSSIREEVFSTVVQGFVS